VTSAGGESVTSAGGESVTSTGGESVTSTGGESVTSTGEESATSAGDGPTFRFFLILATVVLFVTPCTIGIDPIYDS